MTTTFADLGLSPALLDAITARGYETPTRVQATAIGPLLKGQDLVVQAPTGTGKTAAYGLPLLAKVDPSAKRVQALVLTPTRELALQVTDMLTAYAAALPEVKVATLYGGHPFETQTRAIRAGAQVVVATPGRIMEHLRRHTASLDHVAYAVIDEADEMLRMGFLEDVEWILARSSSERQTALFSATIPLPVRRVAKRHCRRPKSIGPAAALTVDTIDARAIEVAEGAKLDALMRLLDAETIGAALVFARTQQSVAELAGTLERHGFRVEGFHGGMSQGHRERVVTKLRVGQVDIVVATDVAARGLDFDRLTHVIVFDAPKDPELWVHRAGRTGRSGRQGHAILLYTKRDAKRVKGIELYTRKRLQRARLPSSDQAAEARQARLKRRIRAVLAEGDQGALERYAKVLAEVVDEGGVEPLVVAAALAKLLHGDRPLGVETKTRAKRDRKGGSSGRADKPRRRPPMKKKVDPDKPPKRRGRAGRGKGRGGSST